MPKNVSPPSMYARRFADGRSDSRAHPRRSRSRTAAGADPLATARDWFRGTGSAIRSLAASPQKSRRQKVESRARRRGVQGQIAPGDARSSSTIYVLLCLLLSGGRQKGGSVYRLYAFPGGARRATHASPLPGSGGNWERATQAAPLPSQPRWRAASLSSAPRRWLRSRSRPGRAAREFGGVGRRPSCAWPSRRLRVRPS